MNIDDLASQVFKRLQGEGYYSELKDVDLKRILTSYLLAEYRKEVKKQTKEIEKEREDSGKEPEIKTYEEAYAQVENKMLYISEELSATTKKDIKDLQYLV